MKKFIQSTKLYHSYKIRKISRKTQKWGPDDDNHFAFYSKFIKLNDLCFDIGANIGNRTKIFHKIVGPKGKVVAVEPQNYCMEILKKTFGKEQNIHLINKALGEKPGEAEIAISNETTLSSMSKDWMKSVKKSKRFGTEAEWDTTQKVSVTTLDTLIETFGAPSFIKIDVEGFEKEVVLGLSRPITTCFSLEFTPEFLASTFDCLDYLKKLGPIQCNYSIGESLSLKLSAWVSENEIKHALMNYKNDIQSFGDVYIRLN